MATQTRTAKSELATAAAAITRNARKAKPQAPEINAAEVQLLIERMEQAREAAKALYTEADGLEDKLIALLGTSAVPLPNGKTARVNDRYIDKDGNVKNKAVAIAMSKRFEVVAK